MEAYLKIFMRQILEHKENLNEYVNKLYEDESQKENLNVLFGTLKKEGFLNYFYGDNRAYEVQLTIKGENIPLSELKLSDKEELLLLISSIGEIEKFFHKSSLAEFELISDVPEYQNWIQQIIWYLQEIFDRMHDQFILDSLNICKKRMRGTNDRKLFNEIVGKLRSIEKNIDKYYQENEQEGKESMNYIGKTPLIFISHSSKDEPHVALIVKLLKEMGFTQKEVFCSSIPGYGIKLSEDIFETLKRLFNEHELYIIFVHSPNYYNSPVCLNEMGAAWVLKNSFCSFLLPQFNYSDMKGVVDSSKISIKIDGERRNVQNLINDLYDDLSGIFSIRRDTSVVWESARDDFIDRMNSIQVVSHSMISKEAKEILVAAEKDVKGAVLISRELKGLTVQAGDKVMNTAGIRREEARMEAAVKELISNGFISHSDGNVFQITDAGYILLDNIKE